MNKANNIQVIEKRLGYTFKTKALIAQALTHKSASHENNERLEFLGDAILSYVIADQLYHRFPKATEGQLTRARASLVKKLTLSAVAQELSLGDAILLGHGEKRSGGFRRDSILADALEALVGALHCDGGFEACAQMIAQWFESRLEAIQPDQQVKDPKTQLQEWLQAKHHDLPVYEILSISGEPHDQTFTVSCEIVTMKLRAEGVGDSRRIAEQMAANKILEQLL